MRYGSCIDGFFGHGATRGMNYFGFGSQLFIGITLIIIVALIIIAVAHNKNKRSTSSSEAEEVLKMRYVNGEISEEAYHKMKKMIQ